MVENLTQLKLTRPDDLFENTLFWHDSASNANIEL